MRQRLTTIRAIAGCFVCNGPAAGSCNDYRVLRFPIRQRGDEQ